MSSLLVFNRVYRMEIQSAMLVFPTPLVNYSAPLTFSLVHLPPLPPSLCKYISTEVCIHTVCNGGGVDRVVWRRAYKGVILYTMYVTRF
jgi:hypothetical protein